MIIALTSNYEVKDYKINKDCLNAHDLAIVERVSRDSFMQELHKIFEDYSNCLEAYNLGYITPLQKEKCQNDLYEESGYTDIYDFLYDYRRWKMGLPINISFKLV